MEFAMSKAEDALKSIDITIRGETADSLRSIEEIIDDVADAWDTLSDSQKQAVSEAMAGTQRSSMFSALIENYEKVKELRDAGLAAEGELAKANQIRVESLAGIQGQLEVTKEALYATIISDQEMGKILKGTDYLLQGLTKLVAFIKNHAVVIIGTLVASFTALEMKMYSLGKGGVILGTQKKITSLITTIGKLMQELGLATSVFSGFIGAMSITGGIAIGIAAFTALNNKIKETRETIQEVVNVSEALNSTLDQIEITGKVVDQYKKANEELSTMLVGTDDYIAKQEEINGLKQQLMSYSPEYKTLLENETLGLEKQYGIMKNMLDLDSREAIQSAIDELPGTGTGIEEKRTRDITGNLGNVEQLLSDFMTAKKEYEQLVADQANVPTEQMREYQTKMNH